LIKLGDKTKQEAIDIAQNIFKKYGLSINPDKCKCIADEGTPIIEFMGVNIGSHLSER